MKRQRVPFDGLRLDLVRKRMEPVSPVLHLSRIQPVQDLPYPASQTGHVGKTAGGPGLRLIAAGLAKQAPARRRGYRRSRPARPPFPPALRARRPATGPSPRLPLAAADARRRFPGTPRPAGSRPWRGRPAPAPSARRVPPTATGRARRVAPPPGPGARPIPRRRPDRTSPPGSAAGRGVQAP